MTCPPSDRSNDAGHLEIATDPEWLERAAQAFAASPRDHSEAVLAILTNDAISAWRLCDAKLWQRVKFRSRLIRARQTGVSGGG